jgi:hypothetical protein
MLLRVLLLPFRALVTVIGLLLKAILIPLRMIVGSMLLQLGMFLVFIAIVAVLAYFAYQWLI